MDHFFGFNFQELINQLHEGLRVLIIRMKQVPHMDQSGVYASESAITELQAFM